MRDFKNKKVPYNTQRNNPRSSHPTSSLVNRGSCGVWQSPQEIPARVHRDAQFRIALSAAQAVWQHRAILWPKGSRVAGQPSWEHSFLTGNRNRMAF